MSHIKQSVIALVVAFAISFSCLPAAFAAGISASEVSASAAESAAYAPASQQEPAACSIPEVGDASSAVPDSADTQPSGSSEAVESASPSAAVSSQAAESQEIVVYDSAELLREGAFPESEQAQDAGPALTEYLHSQLAALTRHIDVQRFAVTRQTFATLYQELLNQDLSLFYVGSQYTLTVSDGYVASVAPTYTASAQEAQEVQKRAQDAIDEIIADCITPQMTDVQKALAVHDYFCTHFEYSLQDGAGAHDYINMLLKHRGVCQAYADAYTKTMQTLGIPCYTVTSYAMRHAWNVIMIDGSYYNVDITWDDRYNTSDDPALGFANHEYFLCSDAEFLNKEKSHYGMDNRPPEPIVSTLYDKAFWQDVDSPLCITADSYYYSKDLGNGSFGIMRRAFSNLSDEQTVQTINCVKPDGSGFVVMGLAEQNGRLYYNTATEIRSCLLNGTEDRLEIEPSRPYASYFVSRMYLSGDTLYYGLGANRDLPETIGTYSLPTRYPISSLTLPASLSAVLGSSGRISAAIEPGNAAQKTLRWESSDPAVLSIESATGTYKALACGSATVTAFTTDGSELQSSCAFTVFAPLASLSVQGAAVLYTGTPESTYSALGTDTQHNSRDVTATAVWSSSNPAVATVSAGGFVTAVAPGQAVLRCKQEGKTGEKKVTVLAPVTEITLTGPAELKSGQKGTISAKVLPVQATRRTLIWTSSNPAAATVSNGVVTARNVSSAVTVSITATAAEGYGTASSHEIRILPKVASVSLFQGSENVTGAKLRIYRNTDSPVLFLTAQAAPADASQQFRWTTSSSRIASVVPDENGRVTVTGLQNGSATITATALDGSGRKAAVTVVVATQATSLSLWNTDPAISRDQGTLQMRALFLPSNVSSRALLWTVEDESGRASIDSKGLLRAIRNGTVTVTASTTDGSQLSASVQVQITNQTSYGPLYGPKLSQTSVSLNRCCSSGVPLTIFPLGEDTITAVQFSDARFSIEAGESENTYAVRLVDSTLKKGRYPVLLTVTTDKEPYEYAFTITVTEQVPSISVKIGRINGFYPDASYPVVLSSRQGSCTLEGIEDDPRTPGFTQSFSLEDGTLRLNPNRTKLVLRGRLRVSVAGYAPKLVPVTLSYINSPLQVSAQPAAFTISASQENTSVSFFAYNRADKSKTPLVLQDVTLALDRHNVPINAGQITASVDPSGRITLSLLESYRTALHRNTSLTVRLLVSAEGWAKPLPLTVSLNLKLDAPSISYSSTRLLLNSKLPGEIAQITLKSSQSNALVQTAAIVPYSSNADGNVTLSYQDGKLYAQLVGTPSGKSYRFWVTPKVQGISAKTTTVTVSLTSAAPQLSLSDKRRRVNVLDRSHTAFVYGLRLLNTVDTVADVQLDSASAEIFTCTYSDGLVTISMRPDAVWQKNQQYHVTLTATLAESGQTLQKNLTLAPTMLVPRVTLPSSRPVFYGNVNSQNNTRYLPVSSSLGHITSLVLSPSSRIPAGFHAVYDAESGMLALSLDGTQPVRAGTYTLTFRAAFAGQAENPAQPYPKQITRTVTVIGSVSA